MGDMTGSQDQAIVVDTAVAATPSKVVGARKTSGGSRAGTPRRTASPRKVPPVPKVPTGYLPSKLSDEVAPTESAKDSGNLIAGLRRVKLVVPSPEEQAARDKKAADERRSTATKTSKSPARSPRKASGARTPRGKTSYAHSAVTSSSSPPSLPTTGLVRQDQPGAQISPPPWGSTESSMIDITMQDSGALQWDPPSSLPPHLPHLSHFDTNTTPPFTPNPTQAPALPGPQSNTYTPPVGAGQTRQGLPVFTSSSPIPFATSGSQNQQRSLGQETHPPLPSVRNQNESEKEKGIQDGSGRSYHGFPPN